MKLQERLKEVRTARQLTLKELAARSGVSVSYSRPGARADDPSLAPGAARYRVGDDGD